LRHKYLVTLEDNYTLLSIATEREINSLVGISIISSIKDINDIYIDKDNNDISNINYIDRIINTLIHQHLNNNIDKINNINTLNKSIILIPFNARYL